MHVEQLTESDDMETTDSLVGNGGLVQLPKSGGPLQPQWLG